MLITRLPVKGQPMRICASCFRRLSTAESPASTASTDTTDTPPSDDPAKPRRHRRREHRPQPGPPDPPWPKPRTAAQAKQARRPHMTPRLLANNIVMINGMRGRFYDDDIDMGELSLGVPRLPDTETDYTEIGPGVVAPWQLGGASFRPPKAAATATATGDADAEADAEVVRALGGPKRMGVKLRVCDTHVLHPYSVKFLGEGDEVIASRINPGHHGHHGHHGSGYAAADAAATALPHCLSEVVRRWYANKNRTDPLWWYVALIANDNAGGADLATIKNVVRSKTHAKVQHAFKTALARRGYSAAGWRLAEREGEGDTRYSHLFGSVRIDAVLQRVLEAEYDDLVTYMTVLLAGVEAELGGKGRVVDGVVTYDGPALGPRPTKRMPQRR